MNQDWIASVIALLYAGKGERSKCKNYRGISLLMWLKTLCKSINKQSKKSK